MKKIIALLIVAILLTTPVLAGFEEEANAYNIKYTIGAYAVKPVLDGKLDGDGAYTKIPVAPGDISYAWNESYDKAEALARGHEFEIYVSYDANNIYALVITDAKSYNCDSDDGDGNVWQKSAIQVSIAGGGDTGTDRLEYGIFRNSENGGQGGVVWAQHPDAKAEFDPVAGTNYVVALDGGKLYYETVIPVNTFLNKDSVAEGDVIGLNFVMAQTDSDYSGHIHTQWSSGCTGDPGKDAERFAKITLGPEIVVAPPPVEVVEEAPAVVDTPAAVTTTTVAPKTNDSIIIVVSVALIALAAAAFIKRRISVK